MLMFVVFAGLAFGRSVDHLGGILHYSTPHCCLEEACAEMRSAEYFVSCRGGASEVRPNSVKRISDHGS
jgi:hypothetical protein